MAVKLLCVAVIFATIFSGVFSTHDKQNYLKFKKDLQLVINTIRTFKIDESDSFHKTVDKACAVYEKLMIEYDKTPHDEEYKLAFRSFMEVTYGVMVGIDSDNVYLEASTHESTAKFWNDKEIITFYNKITDLNHEPEPRIPNSNVDLEANWGMCKHAREDLNLLTYKIITKDGKNPEKKDFEIADAYLRILLTYYERTVEGEDKMSMALFIIHYYEDLYKDRGKESNDLKIIKAYNEARNQYMTKAKDRSIIYLLLKKELDWELIELWKNKETNGKEFRASLSESRRLYVGLSREMKTLREANTEVMFKSPKYEKVFRMFMILTRDEILSIHKNTRQIFLDKNVNDIYNVLVRDYFDGFQEPKKLGYYVDECAGFILDGLQSEWSAANKPPASLDYNIEVLYYLIFSKYAQSKKKSEIANEVPRSLLERYYNKKEANIEFDCLLMAYQKLIRLIGPIKPFNLKLRMTLKEEKKYTSWRGGKPGERPRFEIKSKLYLTHTEEET